MILALHRLKPASGASQKRKRVGRGNASGHGTYSGRGFKGQKSRTGGRNKLKRLGFKKILQSIPKSRGFKSLKSKNQIININQLNQHFKDGDQVFPVSLLKAGLIDKIKPAVKILGQGKLTVKNLHFQNVKLSQSAKEQIEKLAGKIN